MENKTLEKPARYIDLTHLFWYFLQQVVIKWYLFLIIILAGSIAGAGYAIIKNKNQENIQNAESISITEEEFLNIQNAAKLQDALEEQKEYNEQSILMKCNLTYSEAVAVYQVEANDESMIYQIAAICMNLFDDSKLYQRIAEDTNLDIDIKYIKEVFEVENLERGLFKVKAISFSTESATEILESAKNYLKEQKDKLQSEDNYDIILLSEAVSEDIDDTLEEKKQNADILLSKLQESYDSAFDALTQNEKKYFYLYLNARTKEDYIDGETLAVSEDSEFPEIENSLAKRRLMIDTCLGFILGVCGACGYFLIKYCWAKELVNGEELTKMYQLPILGCFIDENKKKGISFWFLKKQKKNFVLKEKQKECKEIIARLKLRFDKENNIYLMSTYEDKGEFENILIEEGKKQGLRLIKSGDILQNSSEFMALDNSDQILFIEKEGKSKYQDINKQLQLVREAEKQVCGMIIIV